MVARARWRSMRPTRSPYVIKQGGEISPSPFQDLTDTKFCTLPGETVFKFIADEPIVDKVFLIIEEKNYFGHRKPNLTCGFSRRLDNFLEAFHRFCLEFIYFSITIIVMRVIYEFFTGE